MQKNKNRLMTNPFELLHLCVVEQGAMSLIDKPRVQLLMQVLQQPLVIVMGSHCGNISGAHLNPDSYYRFDFSKRFKLKQYCLTSLQISRSGFDKPCFKIFVPSKLNIAQRCGQVQKCNPLFQSFILTFFIVIKGAYALLSAIKNVEE